MKAETDFPLILRTLAEAQIDFIAVGAIAAIAQGIIQTTDDVDVVYARSPRRKSPTRSLRLIPLGRSNRRTGTKNLVRLPNDKARIRGAAIRA